MTAARFEDVAAIPGTVEPAATYARCLEPHDLVVSKLVAGREKDLTFATAVIEHGFVAAATLHERAELPDQPNAVIRRVRDLIIRCAPNE